MYSVNGINQYCTQQYVRFGRESVSYLMFYISIVYQFYVTETHVYKLLKFFCTQVSIYGTKTVFLKKPDNLKKKTVENHSLNKNEEFHEVFGTKKSSRIQKSKTNSEVGVSTDIFQNISSNCMYISR